MTNKKVIWITGASSGIGEAVAKEYSKNGYYVILSSRNVSELQRVQSTLAHRDDSRIVPLDVGQYRDIENQVAPVLSEIGRIDVLVNNAGIAQSGKVKDVALDVYEKVMNVNFMGSVAMTKAVLPMMYAQKSGHIAVVSSVMGMISTPSNSGYCASKHAMQGFFECLRAEGAKENIHVTMILPGYVRTNVSVNSVMADGSTYGKMDKGQAEGMAPEKLAMQIYKAISNKKAQLISGGMETQAVKLYRYFPSLYRKMVKRISRERKK